VGAFQSTAEVYCTVRNITVSLMASLAASTRMMRREPGSVIHTSLPPSLKAIDAHTWHHMWLSICGSFSLEEYIYMCRAHPKRDAITPG
jgi:hypothetical protein